MGNPDMPTPESASGHERLRGVLYERSYRRLKKRGLLDAEAGRIANEVARRAVERTQVPDFKSDQEFTDVVHLLCKDLSEGKSYYDLIGVRPYLATGRIDRLVAAAPHLRPAIPAGLALAASKAVGLQRLAGGLAVMFTALALAALGIWYALPLGVFVSVGSELYLQLDMPRKIRRSLARLRLSRWIGVASLVGFLYAGQAWTRSLDHSVLLGFGIVLFAVLVGFVVPSLTLAVLVGLRERRWRQSLEDELARAEPDGRVP
jgi:hypothetical protein